MIKIKFMTCIAFALMLQTAISFAQNKYEIKGLVKGITTGQVVLIQSNINDRTIKVVDSAKIQNGNFEFKGAVASPQLMTLLIKPGNYQTDLFVENAQISVAIDTVGSIKNSYPYYQFGKTAYLSDIAVKGSRTHAEWSAYQNHPRNRVFKDKLTALNKSYALAGKDTAAQNKIRKEMAPIGAEMLTWQKKVVDSLLIANPSSAATSYIFYNYHWANKMSTAEFEQTLKKLKGDAASAVYTRKMLEELAVTKAVGVGNKAPDFTLMRADSSKFTLSSTRGKYVMIDFWASWCHPCREAIPHWKEVYAKYHNKGFDIVSVSDDSSWAAWKKAMDIEKMPWEQVCDEFPKKNMPARIGSLYDVHTIPHYVLLDKEGTIIVNTKDEAEIDRKLKALLD